MKWFNNIKISYRLSGAFLLMFILIAVIGYDGYVGIKDRQVLLNEVYTTHLPSIDFVIEADRDLQQLLVAERSVIFVNIGTKEFQKQIDDYETNLKQAQDRWNQFKKLTRLDKEKEIIIQYDKAWEEWSKLSRQVVEGRKSDTREGRRLALDLTMGVAGEKFDAMREFLNQLQELSLKQVEEDRASIAASYRKSINFIVSMIVIGCAIALIFAVFISRSITKPIGGSLEFIKTMASGDFSQRIQSDRKDEIGLITDNLNSMSEKVCGMIREIREAAAQVASSSEQLSDSSQLLAGAATEQASNLEETSASVEELAVSIEQNAKSAAETNQVTIQASKEADEGGRAVIDTVQAMKKIAEQIRIVTDIADQTNLLALNAAIEAARAGEMGKGFAVVAVEVRKLAERSQLAAKEISSLAGSSVKQAEFAGGLIQKVVPAIQKASGLVQKISSACSEQTEGAQTIRNAIHELDKTTQQNSSTSEESAAASEELSAQARSLQDLVALFKISEFPGNGRHGDFSSNNSFVSKTMIPRAIPHHQNEWQEL